jgi:hypothetical protein
MISMIMKLNILELIFSKEKDLIFTLNATFDIKTVHKKKTNNYILIGKIKFTLMTNVTFKTCLFNSITNICF